MRRIVWPRARWAAFGWMIAVATTAHSTCFAFGDHLFGHRTYYSKTTTKTVTHGTPPAVLYHSPIASLPVAPAMVPAAPMQYVASPMMFMPVAAPAAPSYAPVAPSYYAPAAPSYAPPVAPSYAPSTAPNYAPPAAPNYAPSGQR